MKNITYKNIFGLIAVFTIILSSCKEEFGRLIPDTSNQTDSIDLVYGNPKILLIIADGARGESVRTAQIPVMSGLLRNSIYSWSSLSNEESTGVGQDLADIMTGVSASKHLVAGNDFTKNAFNTYPLVFTRIKAVQRDSSFRVMSSDANFIHYLSANYGELKTDDSQVKTSVISALGEQNVTMVTGHFTGIEKAGEASGFDNSFASYKQAIETFDGQVGEMLAAMRSRPNFKRENWLVIVTSSKGGSYTLPPSQNDNTIFSNPKINTFTIFYSPRYVSKFIGKPYMGNRFNGDFMRFNGEKYGELVDGDNSFFNLGDSSEFTIEMKVKKNRGVNNTYRFPNFPSFFGKRRTWENGAPGNGYTMFFKDNYWVFNMRGTKGAGEMNGAKLNDATWNNITVVGYFNLDEQKRYLRLYTNGVLSGEADISILGNLNNNARTRVGTLPMGGSTWNQADYYISDVRFWNTALSQETITKFNCEIGVTPDHPYYENLVANWLIVGTNENNKILDQGPLGNNLNYTKANFTVDKLNDYLCSPSTATLGTLVPKNTDITAQIYSWLQISRQESWQLDGRVWVDK